MKSKKSNKTTKVNCATCKFYNGNCAHKSNVGIRVKYRQESTFYIKKAEDLKADCKNYERR